MNRPLWICCALLLAGTCSWLVAEEAPRLQIFPPLLTLDGAGDRASIVAVVTQANGRTVDVSAQVKLSASQPELVKIEGREIISIADGTAELMIEHSGQQTKIPLTVKNAAATTAPSFRHDVLPVLTRFGCNQGACHGKLAGQNGFRLSLRGYAPEWDHGWLTREFYGRRISSTTPADSLLIRKPNGREPHGGGRLFEPGSRAEQTLLDWITTGTPNAIADEPAVTKLEVFPGDRNTAAGDTQQLAVYAHYENGRVRDVTWLAQFFTNDASVVEVSPTGLVKCLRAGETVVRVHFQGEVVVTQFTIPFADPVPADQLAERRNVVDQHVFEKLAVLRIPPSAGADDATFLRRVYLDTIGTLPTVAETEQFLASSSPNKRSQLIDELLQRPEWVDFWTLQLCDQLQNRKERDHDVRGTKGVRSFHAWMREQLQANRSWDKIAADVLTSQGSVGAHPQVGYYIVTLGEQRRAEDSDLVSSVAQAFVGTRVGCAKCHNHPLERYTQDDYYRFAAFFARTQLQRKNPAEGMTNLIFRNEEEERARRQLDDAQKKLAEAKSNLEGKEGSEAEKLQKELKNRQQQVDIYEKGVASALAKPPQVRQPRTGQMMPPLPLDRSEVSLAENTDPRTALVRWMHQPTNETFTGNMVNRLWKHFFSVGLVEPVDDLRASNPPSNRPLWQALNREFVEHQYDLKHLMKLMLNSRTYQLSSTTVAANEQDQRHYSHYYARRLPAEVLLDAISQVTEVPDQFPGYPVGLRAIQVPDPGVSSSFLAMFGRSDRVTACACERSGEVTLPQLLHLQCGDGLTQKLNQPESRLKQLLTAKLDNGPLARSIFLSALAREPRPAELQAIETALGDAKTDDASREEAVRDLFWAVLNTKEFAFNH
ncbi:hypothetical protein ETAA8_27190 [Anatilimnocola aggregata]|uniref:Uncharacterized protein n=1 Tax=Anatilimnocola aggregata TaxID=2528021 RepID=A0A517YBP3_9BACT|nr:DUF1549 domain-containing protein [Anatilimnocola aggregata]QDU27631.1 hypothetical protein ETAA8_27190 [Anatilimnocola aggregata]